MHEDNREEASDRAARKLGAVFRAMLDRGEARERAQRFTLQCVVAMFAEDTGLLPRGLFTALVGDCRHGQRSADLLGGLFRQMNTEEPARGGRFEGVRRFEGRLFETIDPIDLTPREVELLAAATAEDWSKVHPGVFGTLFQATMHEGERHERGAHYTPEAAIFEHVVRPSLVEPWRARIREAATRTELLALREALAGVRVLDPACGSGNFLHVAYRALKRLEWELMEKVGEGLSAGAHVEVGSASAVRIGQLFGIDKDPFAVELAKVTLRLAERLAPEDGRACEEPPPIDDLDANVRCDDALFCDWPAADLIIGNPPFQSKNNMQRELGADYVRQIRERYPEVSGRADYCVYWFRRAHDELAAGARAGLVGTNTIRQNSSREGGLDHIVSKGGTITEAVSTMIWPGEAVVHVSIANWIRGEQEGPRRLSWQEGDTSASPWRAVEVDHIPATLSASLDVTSARALRVNAGSGACYQGQTHGHKGFLLTADEARAMCAVSPANAEVIFPYLIGEDLLTEPGGRPARWVIDFGQREEREARRYALPFQRVEDLVLADREDAAARERERNASLGGSRQGNRHHANFLRQWWLLGYARRDLLARLDGLGRYIACPRVTKRPVFEFISTAIHPGDALMVFPLEDDYSFGVLQSDMHWVWFKARCSTLTARFRYTSDTVFDSFPWPQAPDAEQVTAVAEAGVALRALRRELAVREGLSLRAMYTAMDGLGGHPLKDAQGALDAAVRAAYGMGDGEEPLAFLLERNRWCATREAGGESVTGPGLPVEVAAEGVVSGDAVQAPGL